MMNFNNYVYVDLSFVDDISNLGFSTQLAKSNRKECDS